jgi:signal peptidase I
LKRRVFLVGGVVILALFVILAAGYYMSVPYLSSSVRGEKFLRVSGSSMAPTIRSGATIAYDDKFPFEDLKVEDIVVFKKPGSDTLAVRRIIYISPEGWVQTKGDNLPEPESWKITANEYVGKVIRIDNPPS